MGTGTGHEDHKQPSSRRERSQHVSGLRGELPEQGGMGDVEGEELQEMSPSRSGQASRGGIQGTSRWRATRGAGTQHKGEAPRLGSWAIPLALGWPDIQEVPHA